MAAANAKSTINAWLKEVYSDGISALVPEGVKLTKQVKFKKDKKLGDKYIQPLSLTHESGFSVGSGSFSLNDAIAGVYAEAQVQGVNMVLRSQVSYDAMSSAADSKPAFMKWSEQLIGNMTASFAKRLEILHFYGGTSLGQVSANASGALTLTTASWATGIWAGSEGVILEAYDALTSGTQHNGDLTVSSVDLTARIVTVTGTSSAVVANDYLFYKGFYGTEMAGLDKIITNTGTLFNVSASTYALWKGNTSTVTGNLTFAKIQAAVALAVGKGLDEKAQVFVSPATYGVLNTDLSAFTAKDSKYNAKRGENGYEAISFYSLNGELEIIPCIYVKEGEAFIVPVARLCRLGSSDLTLSMPGMGDDMIHQLPSNAGYELRMYYDGAIFTDRPAWCCKIVGFTN